MIPQIYLVEPYNAYAPKGKKKHWMQEVEEQALLAKIVAEQQAIAEAAKVPSNTLPPQAPPTAQATAQAYSAGSGQAGPANSTGGGGGAPRPQFYNPSSGSYTFSITPTTSSAPTTVQFSVVGGDPSLSLGAVQALWTFGDGTSNGFLATSHNYPGTGSFIGNVKLTSAFNGAVLATASIAVTMSVPTITSAFTITGATVTGVQGSYTASANDTLTFVNGASTNNPANTLTYAWAFGSGSGTVSSATNPTFTYTTASTLYTASLGVSGSFNARATSATTFIKIV